MNFNFFKSKPTLKELIPKEFVDIHCHILPGIDDGAKNIEESLKLISEMKKLGFSKIIFTPHTYKGLYDNDNESITKCFNLLKSKVNDIEIHYASEYMIDSNLVKKISDRSILCISGKYVLIEMSYIAKPNNFYEIVFQIIHNGYTPILAHPERYRFFYDNFDEYFKMKKVGCKFQINFLSVVGFYGTDTVKIVEKLLKKSLVDFVASDIHNIEQIKYFGKKVRVNQLNELIRCINNTKSVFI